MQKSTPQLDPEHPPEEMRVGSVRRKTTVIGLVVTVILAVTIVVAGLAALLIDQLSKHLPT